MYFLQKQKFADVNTSLENYLESEIEAHRSSYFEGETRDFSDLFLKYETEHKEFYTSKFCILFDKKL